MSERFHAQWRGLTLDEARAIAAVDLHPYDITAQAAFAAAAEARERLVHALGEALRPDPPMRIVQEALRRAEEYRRLIATLDERPREPVEMTPAEAAAMISWWRPARLKAVESPVGSQEAGASSDEPVKEAPRGQAPDDDLAYEIGYLLGAVLESIAKWLCGRWRRRVK